MKKYSIYLIFLVQLFAVSCSSVQEEKYDPLKMQISQEDKIKLLPEIKSRKLILENCYSIISLPIDSLIEYIKVELKYFDPCAKRKAFYAKFIKELKNHEEYSFYFIQNDITLKDERIGLLYLDSIKYPDQFRLRNNFRAKKIGSKGEYLFDIKTDTNSFRKISDIPGRIVSRMLRAGSATVFNKITGNYEKFISMQATIEKISRYRLLFQSRIPFFKLQVIIDNVDPENECKEQYGNLD